MPVYLLTKDLLFPPPDFAREDGLLAVGGDLSVPRLVLAYCQGIFPWYSLRGPILWWSPDPRLVLDPSTFHVSRRLERTIRQGRFRVTVDTAFEQVIRACSEIRLKKGEETWLTPEMIKAYIELHNQGVAHSAEAWEGDRLVGGLYGIALGRMFAGESMFTKASNASKVAFVMLIRRLRDWGFAMIDCQVTSLHMLSVGAKEVPRSEFLNRLNILINLPSKAPIGKWS